jgi:hypothetical protein
MVGLIYPGISGIDYDASVEGSFFPARIESIRDPEIASWVGDVLHLIPINQRPAGYNPLGVKNLNPRWVQELW